jgi:hypothetical protein
MRGPEAGGERVAGVLPGCDRAKLAALLGATLGVFGAEPVVDLGGLGEADRKRVHEGALRRHGPFLGGQVPGGGHQLVDSGSGRRDGQGALLIAAFIGALYDAP